MAASASKGYLSSPYSLSLTVSALFPQSQTIPFNLWRLLNTDTKFLWYVASCALFLFPNPRKGDFPYFVCLPSPIPQLPQGDSLEI